MSNVRLGPGDDSVKTADGVVLVKSEDAPDKESLDSLRDAIEAASAHTCATWASQ
jgi:hypothetical protein